MDDELERDVEEREVDETVEEPAAEASNPSIEDCSALRNAEMQEVAVEGSTEETLRLYMRQMGRVELLTPDEERRHFESIEASERVCREIFNGFKFAAKPQMGRDWGLRYFAKSLERGMVVWHIEFPRPLNGGWIVRSERRVDRGGLHLSNLEARRCASPFFSTTKVSPVWRSDL